MKKIFFISIMVVFTLLASAQTSKLTGSWLMTKVKTVSNGIKESYFITDFNANGTMQVMGIKAGTWKYNKADKSIILKSKMDKDFNGTGYIKKLTKKELVVLKDGVTMYYTKVNADEIVANNKKLNIEGIWKAEQEDGGMILFKFSYPDSLKVVTTGDGSVSTSHCSWMYNPKEKSIIIIGFFRMLRGKSNLVEFTDNKFVIEHNGTTITALKINEDANKIERLTFKEENFEEDSEEEPALPWNGIEDMVNTLNNIKTLKYQVGTLLKEISILEYHTVISNIKVNSERPDIEFTNLIVTYGDTSQFSQNYLDRIGGDYNRFFPLEEPFPIKVVGQETVTVPAGAFNCTVIEGFDGDTKIKLWMINDMPCVYAKIIRENIDPFGDVEYSVKELVEIVKK